MNNPKTSSAKVIGCIQVKGGAGRSTLATNMAGELSKTHRVILIDCDMPQGTSASWAAIRQQTQPDTLRTITANSHKDLIDKVHKLEYQADYIILDAPPRIAELTRAILVLADLSIIPLGASVPEIWATTDVLSLIAEAQKVREVNVHVLWTRFRPYTRLAQELSAQATAELQLPIMQTYLGLRVAYAEALGLGKTGAEMNDPSAKLEITNLLDEVQSILHEPVKT